MISRKCFQLTSRVARVGCSTSTGSSAADDTSASLGPTITAATRIQSAQQAIGYQFRQPELLVEALQSAGSTTTTPEGNKQLALVGDKLLSFRLALLGRERGERTGKSINPWQITTSRTASAVAETDHRHIPAFPRTNKQSHLHAGRQPTPATCLRCVRSDALHRRQPISENLGITEDQNSNGRGGNCCRPLRRRYGGCRGRDPQSQDHLTLEPRRVCCCPLLRAHKKTSARTVC